MLSAMAWRNIWRNRQRSLITLSVMVFGLFICLLTFAIGDGAHLQMIRVATSTYLGHIQVNAKGFHKSQKLHLVVPEKSAPVRLLQHAVESRRAKGKSKGAPLVWWQRSVEAWTPRLFGAGLVSTGKYSSGGMLMGLDLVRESRVSRLSESILKAMAQEALRSGKYKDRIPASYLHDIEKSLATQKKQEGVPKEKKERLAAEKRWIRHALHEATTKLIAQRDLYEKTLKSLIRTREVVLGKGLATVLKASPGSSMAVATQAYDGSMGNDRYTVVGIAESGSADMDISLCILPIQQLQELLVLEGYYHTLTLKLDTDSGSQIRKVASAFTETLRGQKQEADDRPFDKELAATATPAKAWEILPWQRVSPELYEFIRADEASQYLMALIVFFLVAFIILNTLQMSLMERTREFGVLMSLGMKGRKLVGMVMMEGVWLAVVAIVLGLALGIPAMAYLQAVGIPLGEPLQMGGIALELKLEGRITLQGLLFSPGIVLLTTLLVSFYPAYRVTKLKPTEALRHV